MDVLTMFQFQSHIPVGFGLVPTAGCPPKPQPLYSDINKIQDNNYFYYRYRGQVPYISSSAQLVLILFAPEGCRGKSTLLGFELRM